MTIGTLFAESRLIAKTVNRIILDPDYVGLQDWVPKANCYAVQEAIAFHQQPYL